MGFRGYGACPRNSLLRPAQQRYQVRKERKGGLLDAWIVFDDRQLAHRVRIEDEDVAEPADRGQRIEDFQVFRLDLADDLPAFPVRPRDQANAPVAADGSTHQLSGVLRDARALDILGFGGTPHQRLDENRELGRGIPAIDIQGWVGFGDPLLLNITKRRIERSSLLHLREDVIGRAVQNAVERANARRRQCLPDQVEYRRSIHDGGFVEETHVGAPIASTA